MPPVKMWSILNHSTDLHLRGCDLRKDVSQAVRDTFGAFGGYWCHQSAVGHDTSPEVPIFEAVLFEQQCHFVSPI